MRLFRRGRATRDGHHHPVHWLRDFVSPSWKASSPTLAANHCERYQVYSTLVVSLWRSLATLDRRWCCSDSVRAVGSILDPASHRGTDLTCQCSNGERHHSVFEIRLFRRGGRTHNLPRASAALHVYAVYATDSNYESLRNSTGKLMVSFARLSA